MMNLCPGFRQLVTAQMKDVAFSSDFHSSPGFFFSMHSVVNTLNSCSNICCVNPYPTAFPYGNGMVLHFYQQQESSTTKTVHKVINKGLKTYV